MVLNFYLLVGVTFIVFTCLLPFVIDVKLAIPPPYDMGNFDFFYKVIHFGVMFYLFLNSVICDVLYITILGLCIAQLVILQEKLLDISVETNSAEPHNQRRFHSEVEKDLKQIIILHMMINKFVKKLSTLLSLPLFIQYCCGCLIVCNTILQLTFSNNIDTTDGVNLITYSAATLSQLVLYHWMGNEIMFKSNKIIESCYLSQWYQLNPYCQKFILMLMESAKRPLVIEVYSLVHISVDSLAVIIKWSYSLFAVTKARYN
ncbi:7tm Odorant receptor [Popillia japonica]|uniref:7tm Odorant receptor n=1 Tax=Popillia japonica TaxID=7064 RepID=A0AAW1L8B4_POPJA